MTAWGHSVAPHGPRESPQRVLVEEKGNSRGWDLPRSPGSREVGPSNVCRRGGLCRFQGKGPSWWCSCPAGIQRKRGPHALQPCLYHVPTRQSLAPCELGAQDLAVDFQQHSVSGHSGPKQPVWGPVTTPFLPTAGHRGSAKFHIQDGPAMPTLHLGIPQEGPTRTPPKVAVTSAQTVPVNSSRHQRCLPGGNRPPPQVPSLAEPWPLPYCAHPEWSHSTQQPPLPRAFLTCYLPSTHQTELQRQRELRRTSVHSCPAQAMHHWAASRDSPCWR